MLMIFLSSKYHLHGHALTQWWSDWMAASLAIINPKERNEKVRRHFCTQTLTNFHSLPELTRYTNPLKSKFRAKRLAAESQLFSYILRVFNATADLSLSIISRWRCLCSSNQTAHRPNARRISTPKQNSLPPKSSRIRHERATAGSLFSVGFFFLFPFDLPVVDIIPS